jgi:ABC-type hemin transport system substrate-binding protein
MGTPTLSDDLGREVDLAAPPRRIVSLVPSLTELICSLGAAGRLVGVTRFCTEPAAVVARLPRIGGTKNPQVESVSALTPDLVLVNSEENRRDDFDQLLAAGLRVFVSFPTSVAAAADGIERLGRLLGVEPAGRALAGSIRATLASLSGHTLAELPVFCPIWRKPWMSFNRDTYADDILRCAGGENVCAADATRYPVLDLGQVAAAAPRVILLPDEPYPFAARHRPALAGLAGTPAMRLGRVYLVDGKALSWYGPRTPAALCYFAHIFSRW